jgi:hypothetical protein
VVKVSLKGQGFGRCGNPGGERFACAQLVIDGGREVKCTSGFNGKEKGKDFITALWQ